MPEGLIGVLIGGLIAWVAPLLTLRYNERRWRFEARLNHLKAERDRFEKLYESSLQQFGQGLTEDAYSSVMIADMLIVMPKEINELYEKWMRGDDRSEANKKNVYLNMAAAMKRDIAARDAQIRELLDQ